MIFPPQTSLIAVTVALVRFLESTGATAWGSVYPYWYLGTTAYKFLIGPVIPIVASFIHNLYPGLSLFNVMIYIVAFSFVISILGWSTLSFLISGNIKIAVIFGLILLIMPWRYFSAIAINEASITIAKNLLPLTLIASWLYIQKRSITNATMTILSISLVLLVNTDALPLLIVGLSSLVLARGFKKGKVRFQKRTFKRILLIIGASLLVVTLWYSPAYWMTILTNPSIGGVSGFRVIFRIFDFARAALPFLLAIVAVYFSGKIKSSLGVFASIWVLTFLLLTIFRFLADWDFWMDWSLWMGEVEIGLGLLIVSNSRKVLGYLVLLTIPILVVYFVYRAMGKPKLISNTVPEGVKSIDALAQSADDKLVFTSGATTFWLNAFYDTPQVRGGRDEVSDNAFWYKLAYEFREGKDLAKTQEWIEKTELKYILVHEQESDEYYHDFRYTDKWKELGKVVWENEGDILYEIP
ncbi:hypothetical protein ACFL1Q_02850 [Patescibacteria group bacterium]